MTLSGKADTAGLRAKRYAQPLRRGSGDSMYTRKAYATREAPWRGQSNDQLEAREGQAGRFGVAERFVVPLKPGNAGGGKGPQFKAGAESGDAQEIGETLRNSGNVRERRRHHMLKRRNDPDFDPGSDTPPQWRR